MSKDKRKRKARAYAMIRELNARSFRPYVGLCPPTISRRPGPDLRYAIKLGMVKLRRVYRSARVTRTSIDTGFWPFH
jgi:hypothetical protein